MMCPRYPEKLKTAFFKIEKFTNEKQWLNFAAQRFKLDIVYFPAQTIKTHFGIRKSDT